MKVLLSRPDKIGDVVLALHAAKQLKRYCPEFEVFLDVSDYTRSLVENIDFIDGVVTWGDDLAPYKFDAVVDLMAKFVTARRYSQANIPLRIGNAARWFRFLYTNTSYIRRSRALRNEAEYNWHLISLLDPRLHNTRLRESVTFEDLKEVKYLELPRPYYCLFPGITVSAETWPLQSWCELTNLLLDNTGNDVVLLLGPAEKALKKDLESALPKLDRVHIKQISDLKLVAGVLKECEEYIGPSTGITHLAGIVGAEGVALYPEVRSMHPDRWAPFISRLRINSPASKVSPKQVSETLVGNTHSNGTKREKLSAFVICKNEEKNIGRCLESISFADEIVVVDSGSTDRTLQIVKSNPKAKVISRAWPGHREQKQFALEQCSHKWVLNLDADEELSSELKGQIMRVLEDDQVGRPVADGYLLCRVVYYLNRWWDHGGWHPEHRMRFFQREHARWGGLNPHEKAHVSGSIKKLRGFLYHYTFDSITEFIETQNKFSLQSAHAMNEQGIKSSLTKMIVRPVFRFFKFFVIKAGFREGKHGFIQAVLEAVYTFLKYAKLWEIQRSPKKNIEAMTRVLKKDKLDSDTSCPADVRKVG